MKQLHYGQIEIKNYTNRSLEISLINSHLNKKSLQQNEFIFLTYFLSADNLLLYLNIQNEQNVPINIPIQDMYCTPLDLPFENETYSCLMTCVIDQIGM